MIFQKKIIIGSIMSFIATAVGIIAVFFPDLLNLQKKKMEKIEMGVTTTQDFSELEKFLGERVIDNKIFELDLDICFSEQDKNRGLAFNNYEDDAYLTLFDMDEESLRDSELESLSQCDSDLCSGETFVFSKASTRIIRPHRILIVKDLQNQSEFLVSLLLIQLSRLKVVTTFQGSLEMCQKSRSY